MAATNVQAFSGDVEITSNLTVNTSTLLVDSVGNRVGIGTTNPISRVNIVQGVGGAGPFAPLANLVSVDGITHFGIYVGEKVADPFSQTCLRCIYNTDTVLVADGYNKRVGIGVGNPDARLHVQEPTSISTTTTLFHTENGFTGGSRGHFEIVEKKVGAGTGWSDFALRLHRRVDNVEQGYIEFNPDGSSGDYGIAFGNSGGGGPGEIMRINGGSGKVGIGTTDPTGQLEVRGAGQTLFHAFSHSGNMGGTIVLRDSGNASGNGGAIMFGTLNGFHAAIKALVVDGTTNTVGDLSFFTRGAIGDSTMAQRMTIRNNGNVGIGITDPSYRFHVTGGKLHVDGANALMMEVKRSGLGPTARIGSDDGVLEIGTIGTTNGWETVTMQSYIDQGNQGTFSAYDRNLLVLQPYNGRVGIGITNPPETLTVQHPGISPTFGLRRKTYNDYVVYMKNTGGQFQTVNLGDDAVLLVGKGSSTNRSINAEGTINASGEDYAEYMKKSRSDLVIKKGDIVGVNNDGELTNVFSESIQFVVKSTNPSYVGGSSWNQGTVSAPKDPSVLLTVDEYSNVSSNDATLYSYWEEQKLYANTEQLNTFYEEYEKYLEDKNIHREPYDRIAFCGQVPVNVYNATPGQYIIPKQTDDDTISYELTNTTTFEQYQISIGKVLKIQEDGRAFILVKIS